MKVEGTVRVPGDKSITHRLLMLAAMARGTSHVGGALTSLDARSTARCLRALGASVSHLRPGSVVAIGGTGRLRAPEGRLDCGNAGTAARLLLGLLAAHRFSATLTGDASLRRRPMRRVTEPLEAMGARFVPEHADTLPLTVRGGRLGPLRWELPVSSAQVKGSLLFAAMAAGQPLSFREPGGRSRDHSERLLGAFGYGITERDGWTSFSPTGRIEPFDIQVPGDPSSAAFLVGAALLAEAGAIRITGVGLNPTRTGFLSVIARMGGRARAERVVHACGEPVGDLRVESSPLRSTEVHAHEIPSLVDEVPLLAVLASRAEGTTVFHRVGELRVKESDRLALIAANLRAVGSRAEVDGEDLHVEGGQAPPRGKVRTDRDHRLAMAFSVLGTIGGARVTVDHPGSADVSFPGFAAVLRSIRRASR